MAAERRANGWLLVEQIPAAVAHKVLLMPGLQGSDLVFARLMQAEALQQHGVHVVAGNPPGFKGLPVPPGFDYSVPAYAGLVEELAAAEGFALILGHSFAANVLIEVAARGRYRGKLVLVSPSLHRQAETKDLLMLDAMSRKPLLRGIVWWLTYRMMASVFKPYFDDPAALRAAVRDGRRIPRCVGRKILLGYFDHLDSHGDLAVRLLQTAIPVTYVRGTRDDIAFTAADRDTLARSPLIRVREVEGARHFAMIDKPDEVAALLLEALG